MSIYAGKSSRLIHRDWCHTDPHRRDEPTPEQICDAGEVDGIPAMLIDPAVIAARDAAEMEAIAAQFRKPRRMFKAEPCRRPILATHRDGRTARGIGYVGVAKAIGISRVLVRRAMKCRGGQSRDWTFRFEDEIGAA
jgi:hypothetical protein